MEPRVTGEILGNQRRAADFAVGVTHETAIGLVRERHLRDASDHQRVSDAGDQGHQDQQAQGRTYHCGHFKILEFGEQIRCSYR